MSEERHEIPELFRGVLATALQELTEHHAKVAEARQVLLMAEGQVRIAERDAEALQQRLNVARSLLFAFLELDPAAKYKMDEKSTFLYRVEVS